MAQAAKATNVRNIVDEKKKREDRPKTFSQKSKYVGPTASLTLYVRESKPGGPFNVYALFEKKGAKKEKGVVTAHKTQAEALKKYDELGQSAITAGWKLSMVGKSAFDAIPAVE